MLPISLEAVLQLVDVLLDQNYPKIHCQSLRFLKLSFLIQNCYGIHSHTPKEGHHKLND